MALDFKVHDPLQDPSLVSVSLQEVDLCKKAQDYTCSAADVQTRPATSDAAVLLAALHEFSASKLDLERAAFAYVAAAIRTSRWNLDVVHGGSVASFVEAVAQEIL